MEPIYPTTPFGGRTLTLAHIASQIAAKECPPDKAVHKWSVFRDIRKARIRLGLSERALSLLNALLTFLPETAMTLGDLIVFPSNEQLALRANGMPESTMRRLLAVLVDAGVLIRRDSPNGKRFSRQEREGQPAQAFGFDLSPLVARADEFAGLAAAIEADERALKYARERITIARRDVAGLIATGIEENIPFLPRGQGVATWQDAHEQFREIVLAIPRGGSLGQLHVVADELNALADHLRQAIENHVKTSEMSGNGAHNERHIQNSNTNPLPDLEPAFQESGAAKVEPQRQTSNSAEVIFPLGMVLQACPDIADYAKGGEISHWCDLLAAASVARGALAISPSAWGEAQAAMGEKPAAIVIAAILQRSDVIASRGGYLRELTRKAQLNEFSVGPMLMALIGAKNRGRKRA